MKVTFFILSLMIALGSANHAFACDLYGKARWSGSRDAQKKKARQKVSELLDQRGESNSSSTATT